MSYNKMGNILGVILRIIMLVILFIAVCGLGVTIYNFIQMALNPMC